MRYAALADLVLIVHLGFVVFVSAGALAVFLRPRLVLVHIPFFLYGTAIEVIGWTCPLTPLEQNLRRLAGQESYAGGFIQHYVGDLLYPANWNTMRWWMGLALVAFNAIVYALLLMRRRRARQVG